MQRRQVMASMVAAAAATMGSLKHVVVSASAAMPTDHIITIKDFVFVPKTLSIREGDRVTWVNSDIVPHTATAADGSWDTENIAPNGQHAVMINEGFTESYYCRYHPTMTAKLDIE